MEWRVILAFLVLATRRIVVESFITEPALVSHSYVSSPTISSLNSDVFEESDVTKRGRTRHMLHGNNDGLLESNSKSFHNETEVYSVRRRQVLQWSSPIVTACLAGSIPGSQEFLVPNSDAKTLVSAELVPSPAVIPFSSTRRYKRISLRNGLSALLVSDKNVAMCQAAVSIPAGQFYDGSVPGLAHLMEHMVLSTSVTSSTRRGGIDLESWLSEREGASNAFTANQKVCFHLTCPKQVFSETLERFAAVFRQKAVEAVCRDRSILRREIRRVDSELNFDSIYSQEEHLTKVREFIDIH